MVLPLCVYSALEANPTRIGEPAIHIVYKRRFVPSERSEIEVRRQGSVEVFAPGKGYQPRKGFFKIPFCVSLTTVNVLLIRARA